VSIDEIFLETLQKSCHEARAASADLLLKSQMGFDFGSPSPNPHANHKAYQRTSASGAVSQIQQEGSPHQEMVKELHDAFERHDKRGRGGMGITHEHPDYSTPEKYAKTAKNILKFRGHERLGKKGAGEVEGMLKRHIGAIEGDEQPVTVQDAKKDEGHKISHWMDKVKVDKCQCEACTGKPVMGTPSPANGTGKK